MNNTYHLEITELNAKWDNLIANSPDGTIFTNSVYLMSIQKQVRVFYCKKKQEIKAGVVLVVSDDILDSVKHDLVIYSGLIFAPSRPEKNRHQVISENFRIATFIANNLADQYNKLFFNLPPTIKDIRPFIWHNYGTDSPKYNTEVRYTSFV